LRDLPRGTLYGEEKSLRSESANAIDESALPQDGALFPIVGVGASAGGLEAFTELLKHLPLDTAWHSC